MGCCRCCATATGSRPHLWTEVLDVFYINLDRATDRRAFMEAQAKAGGLVLNRQRATEPGDLASGDHERFRDAWERPIAANELALLRSHVALWKLALDRPEGLVVLEDDAVLSPRFGSVIDRLPEGYDLINLEDFGKKKFFARRPDFTAHDFSVSRVMRDKAGAAAYHVSPRGAAKLLALADHTAAPADAFLFGLARLDTAQVEPALACQAHILAGRGLDPGVKVPSSLDQGRVAARRGRRNPRVFLRKAGTELRLAAMHLRRLVDVELRAPVFDADEFRGVLPIRIEDQAAAQTAS